MRIVCLILSSPIVRDFLQIQFWSQTRYRCATRSAGQGPGQVCSWQLSSGWATRQSRVRGAGAGAASAHLSGGASRASRATTRRAQRGRDRAENPADRGEDDVPGGEQDGPSWCILTSFDRFAHLCHPGRSSHSPRVPSQWTRAPPFLERTTAEISIPITVGNVLF